MGYGDKNQSAIYFSKPLFFQTDSVFEVGSRPDEDCFVSEEDFLAGEAIHSSRKAKRAITDATESNSAAK